MFARERDYWRRDRSVANIDHLAVAVNSLDEAVPLWTALLGEKPSGREEVSDEGVRVALFGEGAGRIELLEPTEAETPVGRFLDRQGPGLHHVCLRVAHLEEALERAEEAGAEVLEPRIRTGAEDRRVAFLHPRSAGGVLVELSEIPASPHSGENSPDDGSSGDPSARGD